MPTEPVGGKFEFHPGPHVYYKSWSKALTHTSNCVWLRVVQQAKLTRQQPRQEVYCFSGAKETMLFSSVSFSFGSSCYKDSDRTMTAGESWELKIRHFKFAEVEKSNTRDLQLYNCTISLCFLF
uniref:Uncharacterized protein n=1 Tax=Micrurus lemniscatus lemniscatus TaxID=129467 RepID=A0A2D4IJ17_MICLE